MTALMMVTGVTVSASAVVPEEYQSKAARVTRLAQVTTWPAQKLTLDASLVIGVFGDEDMVNYLQEAVQGRRINGHEVVVRYCSSLTQIPSCHVLFVGKMDQKRQGAILRRASAESILTLGDSDAFMERGGIVCLTMKDGVAQFTFNNSNLKRSRLEIDPETLALAYPQPRR